MSVNTILKKAQLMALAITLVKPTNRPIIGIQEIKTIAKKFKMKKKKKWQ